jgi:hypothetical protein
VCCCLMLPDHLIFPIVVATFVDMLSRVLSVGPERERLLTRASPRLLRLSERLFVTLADDVNSSYSQRSVFALSQLKAGRRPAGHPKCKSCSMGSLLSWNACRPGSWIHRQRDGDNLRNENVAGSEHHFAAAGERERPSTEYRKEPIRSSTSGLTLDGYHMGITAPPLTTERLSHHFRPRSSTPFFPALHTGRPSITCNSCDASRCIP